MATHAFALLRSAALISMVLCASPAWAQSDAEVRPEQPREISTSLKVLLGTQTILHSADMITTAHGLRLGGREANPLLAPFAGRPAALIAVSSAVNVLQTFTITRLHRRNPKLAKLWAVVLIGTEGYVVAHNIRVARDLKRGR